MATMSTDRFRPDYAVAPGVTLAELLEEHDMTQTKLAENLGVSLKHVNQVVKGTASISAELALGLEKVLGVPAAFWVSRDSHYRADLARHDEERALEEAQDWAKRFPIRELQRRELLREDAKGPELVAELLRFLGIANPGIWSDPTVAYRRSKKFESDPYALSAWLRVGELAAADIPCQPYNEDEFRNVLKSARSLTRLKPSQWQPRLVDSCAQAGVAVVIVPAFTGARANGVTRWLSPAKALIQLSLRQSWEDVFWYSFFHEGGHVLLHRKKLRRLENHNEDHGFLEGSRPDSEDDPEAWRLEEEADRFASRLLIPPEHEDELQHLKLDEVPSFARRLDVAPAIVVGRLQHEGLIPFSRGNDMRRRFVSAEGRP